VRDVPVRVRHQVTLGVETLLAAANVEADVEALLDVCRAANPTLAVISRRTLAREPLETPETADIVAWLQAVTRLVCGQHAPIAP